MTALATTSADDARHSDSAAQRARGGGFLQHAAVYGLGSISVQLVGLVLLPLYTNVLSSAEYGVLQLVYRVGDVLNICLMVNGIRLATLNFWGRAEDDRERRRIAPSVAAFCVLALVVGSLVVVVASGPLARLLGVADPRLLGAGIVAMMMQATTVMPLALMQARLESKRFATAAVLIALCQVVLVVIALLVLHWGVWGVVLAIAVTYGLFGGLLTARELWNSSLRPSRRQMVQLAQFSLPFVPSGLCLFVLHNGDQFFLTKYHGLAVLGVYALGYRIVKGVVMLATQPLMQVWSAWMYDVYKSPGRAATFGCMFTRITAAFCFAGVAVFLFRRELLRWLASPDFQQATVVIGPLLLAHGFLVFASLLDGAFYVTRRTNLKPWIAAASTVVMLTAYALLIPRWGAVGAAQATLIGFLFHCGLTLWLAQRTFRIDIEYRRLAALLATTLAVGLGGSLLGTGLWSVPPKCLLIAFAPGCLWFGGLVTDAEKELVRRSLAGIRRR